MYRPLTLYCPTLQCVEIRVFTAGNKREQKLQGHATQTGVLVFGAGVQKAPETKGHPCPPPVFVTFMRGLGLEKDLWDFPG